VAYAELVQVNRDNLLMVEVRLVGWEDIRPEVGVVEYRQVLPTQVIFPRVPWDQAGTILTFVGALTDTFRLQGLFYDAGDNIVGAISPPLDYNPTERRLIRASGVARSGGRARFAGFDVLGLPWIAAVWSDGPGFAEAGYAEGDAVPIIPVENPRRGTGIGTEQLPAENLVAEGTPGTYRARLARVSMKALDEGRYLSGVYAPAGLPLSFVMLAGYDPTTVVPRPTMLSVRGAPAYVTLDINANNSVRTQLLPGTVNAISQSGLAGRFHPHLVIIDVDSEGKVVLTVDDRAPVTAAQSAELAQTIDRITLGPGSGQGYADVDYVFFGIMPTDRLSAESRAALLKWAQDEYGVGADFLVLEGSASGVARSGGRADLWHWQRHYGSASGLARSAGQAALDLVTVNHRASASGLATTGGSAALELRGPATISAAGLARSGGRAALLQGSLSTIAGAGAARSGGRARLRVRAPVQRTGRLARAFPQQVTIEHRAPADTFRDEFGDVPLVVTSTEEVACNLQPVRSTESTANQAQESEAFNLYLPPGVELGAQDRVILEGVALELDGAGQLFTDFGGHPHHVQATLRRVA
jgi:hypothetical protein